MTTDNTRALVAQLREALDWCIAEINRESPATVNARPAIAAADRWLQQPEHEPVSDDEIREVFLANGFTIKPGNTDLKPYVFSAARALLALRPARVPADRCGIWVESWSRAFVQRDHRDTYCRARPRDHR